MSFLSYINNPEDLDKLNLQDLSLLSQEIREKIINVLSVNGGHLSSNLGIVELTIALHKVFKSPFDKFIFDTSHQCYTHKLLTGRNKDFHTLRLHKGISGFSNPKESPHDHLYAGHAGACFSQALGIAKNRDFNKENYHVLPILGDASFTCGLTLEALNNIFKNLKKFIVVLNDNKMAISKNVGHIKNILNKLINSPTTNKIYSEIEDKLLKIPNIGQLLAFHGQKLKESIKNLVSQGSFFEHFGLSYIGPIDGHDINKLINTFSALKNLEKPAIVHVITTKGKGLCIAKKNPSSYHGVKPFYLNKKKKTKLTFPKIFGKYLVKFAEKDPDIIALSPAMLEGSGLSEFKEKFPDRCFDVGIAEGHCITFAAGLALKKLKVIACVYSSFLQRAFDNIFHDICLQNIPILIAIDRAGLSGPDGATHHGIYDISFLKAMPNLIITQPRNGHVLREIMYSAFSWNAPVVMRYPNLETTEEKKETTLRQKKGEVLLQGNKFLIIALGHMYKTALEAAEILKKHNIYPTIVDPVFVKPLDENLFLNLLSTHPFAITIEEHSIWGFGSIFNSFIIKNQLSTKVLNLGIDSFVEHGSNEKLLQELGLDADTIANKILKLIFSCVNS